MQPWTTNESLLHSGALSHQSSKVQHTFPALSPSTPRPCRGHRHGGCHYWLYLTVALGAGVFPRPSLCICPQVCDRGTLRRSYFHKYGHDHHFVTAYLFFGGKASPCRRVWLWAQKPSPSEGGGARCGNERYVFAMPGSHPPFPVEANSDLEIRHLISPTSHS